MVLWLFSEMNFGKDEESDFKIRSR